MKKNKSNEKRKEPWSKRRIEANIAEWKKDISRVNERRKGTFEFEKKDLDRMEREYRLSDVGNLQVIDIKPLMLKKLLKSGAILVDT